MQKYTHHQPPACPRPLGLVYVDDDIVVVDKPEGLLSVPGRLMKDCALARLQSAWPDVRVVHRLDLDTSGLLVLGLSQLAVSDLNRQFRERVVGKRYIAQVDGVLARREGQIDAAIAPDPINRPRQQIVVSGGKQALTRYQLIFQGADSARLALQPVTGRSHQLRLHMAHLGHPILGCDLYAHDRALAAAPRLMLHASELTFTHPAHGTPLKFISTPPF